MLIERKWAMPNRWTFKIIPIKALLEEEMTDGLWIDPFAGKHSPAKVRNDLNPAMPAEHHLEALDFLRMFDDASVDGLLFDPPYSPAKVKQCYQNIGTALTGGETSMRFWSSRKDEVARVMAPGGKVICCGWNSMGICMKRGFEITRVLLVPHGGAKNDTIVTVEIKKG